MTTNQILLQTLQGHIGDRPPFWFMRQAGRFLPEYRKVRASAGSFLNLCYDSALAEEVTLQPVRRFDTDAAILFADILLVPQALGQKLEFHEGEGPVLDPIRDQDSLSKLHLDKILEGLAPVIETVSRVRSSLPGDKTLIGFAGAPWTVATYMVEGGSSRDYSNVKNWAYRDPVGFNKLIHLLEEATFQYLIAQARAGADVLQLFDTWAGVLPVSEQEKWVIGPTRRIINKIREVIPEIPIIGFPKGIGMNLKKYAENTRVSAVGLDTSVDQTWAARYLQPICAVQGNLDPGVLFSGGDAMTMAAMEIVDGLKGGPHIFNLGHGIWPGTDPDHLSELIKTLKNVSYAATN